MPKIIRTPHDAELFAAELMRRWGFGDARATPVGADAGIDVLSRDALAQVKLRSSAAGRPDLQRLYGARGHGTQRLLFFAASHYSKAALTYANEMDIRLFVFRRNGDVVPANAAAKGMMPAQPRRFDPQDVWVFVSMAFGLVACASLFMMVARP